MSLRDLLGSVLSALTPQELVCKPCLRPGDTITGSAGDFSLCERCHASITSQTGHTVRNRPQQPTTPNRP